VQRTDLLALCDPRLDGFLGELILGVFDPAVVSPSRSIIDRSKSRSEECFVLLGLDRVEESRVVCEDVPHVDDDGLGGSPPISCVLLSTSK